MGTVTHEADDDVRAPMIDRVGNLIFGIRWGLVPMYLGLWVSIVAYNVQFFREMGEFFFDEHGHLRINSSTDYLLWVLNLIDITMIGNLVVMITVGGFSTFVKEFNLKSLQGKPRWMNKLDSSTLKIKMGMSLVGVSAIYLLKTFMESGTTSWDTIGKVVLIHVVFIFTTIAFSINARLLHGHHEQHDENKGHH
jgi:uncharacterized protein (TIGR00645 family)